MHAFLRRVRLAAALVLLLSAGRGTAEVQIRAEGADKALLDNLRAHLPLAGEPCDAPRWRIRRRLKKAADTLDPALRAFGYYESRIATELTEEEDDCWLAEIEITLGEPVRLREVRIEITGEGAGTTPFEAIRSAPGAAAGEVLRHDRYEGIKSQLRNRALEYGYFDAEFQASELRVDPAAGQADIRLSFDTGRRYRVGALTFSEQPLDEDFIRRLGALEPGVPYSARDLTALDRHLSDAGYFSRVDVLPQHDEAVDSAGGREIPVYVQLTAKKRHAWRFGVGFETDTGPRFSVRYDNYYVNPRGHQFSADLRLSPVISELTGNYTVPGQDPHKETFVYSGGYRYEDTEGTLTESVELSGRQILRRPDWTETRSLRLMHERSDISGDTVEGTFLIPGIAWDRIVSDDPLRTHRGYRLHLDLSGAHEALLSTASFLRLEGRAKGIYRFDGAGRVTGRVNAGAISSDSFGDLPSSLRFYAGGDNSVRGYGYKRLAPRDDDGEPIGGRYLLTGSLEYEHPVSEDDDWWAAAFVDAGNAFDTEDFELKLGYGIGVRWYSPVGRLRLDLARPQDTTEDDFRIHFGMGADL